MGRGRRVAKKPRLDPNEATVAIVGSGLAGLSTALALQQQGFRHVHVFERDASLHARREGYGMTITYNPRGVLGRAQLGILESLAVADCPSRSHYMLQAPEGHVMGYFGNAFCRHRGIGQRGNLRVPRQKVRQILWEALQQKHDKDTNTTRGTVQIHWNHALCSVSLAAGNTENDINTSTHNNHNAKGNTVRDDPLVELQFTNGEVIQADLVVAADGWNSAVLRHCLSNASSKLSLLSSPVPTPRCQSLGVYIIVGLARNVRHPLVNECGFYTLGPRQRFFVMPFSADTVGGPEQEDVTTYSVTMWQLSFVTPQPSIGQNPDDPTDATSYIRSNPAHYWQQAYHLVHKWHAPVPELLQSTPIDSVWGTLLHDVNPVATATQLQASPFASRIVPLGDALHAMSPFKGQGANQALQDGALLAHRLSRGKASRDAAVKATLLEIVQRTAPVVRASREAAAYWHDEARWFNFAEHAWAGLASFPHLPQSLRDAGINATSTQGKLDAAILRHVQEQYGVNVLSPSPSPTKSHCLGDHSLCGTDLDPRVILETARRGDLEQLRVWTWEKHARLLQSTVHPVSGDTCLHAAVQGGLEHVQDVGETDGTDKGVQFQHLDPSYAQCLKWLVTQAGCSVYRTNRAGDRPCDLVANKLGIYRLLQQLQAWEDSFVANDGKHFE